MFADEFVIDQYSMGLVTRGQLTIYQSYRIRQKMSTLKIALFYRSVRTICDSSDSIRSTTMWFELDYWRRGAERNNCRYSPGVRR